MNSFEIKGHTDVGFICLSILFDEVGVIQVGKFLVFNFFNGLCVVTGFLLNLIEFLKSILIEDLIDATTSLTAKLLSVVVEKRRYYLLMAMLASCLFQNVGF